MRRLVRISSVLAPAFLIAGDTAQLVNSSSVVWTVLLWFAFLFFVPAIIGLAVRLGAAAPRLSFTGGTVALVGTLAGATMQGLFRAIAVLETGGHAEAARFLGTQPVLAFTTLMPGIFFPIGLLILAAALWRARAPRWLAATLAVGAILFPVGHAAGVAWALIGGDVVLLAAFALADRFESAR